MVCQTQVENPNSLVVVADCLPWLRDLEANSVNFVIGSPPYAEKGLRYLGGVSRPLPTAEWVPWMADVTEAAVAACSGYVMWVVNGAVRKGAYLPACELLVAEAYNRGIGVERPCIWHKNAPPNRKDWFGNDWEYILAFKKVGSKPNFDWESIAEPPKYDSGGRFRQRTQTGERRLGNEYPQNKLARPRDVFRVTVGGGHLGSKLAHENEAPFPEKLVEPFIKVCCPENGIVLDPFCGSGTTLAVATRLGRLAVGVDVRESQVELTHRRLAEVREELDQSLAAATN